MKKAPQVPAHAKRVRLQDVADMAGVSLGAASLALRGGLASNRISQKTRSRIQAVAWDLGYSPDPAAQALARSTNPVSRGAFYGTLALLSRKNDVTQLAWRSDKPHEWEEALIKTASELGYAVDTFELPNTSEKASRLMRQLRARNIRGLIVHACNEPLPEVEFRWEEFATILLSPPPREASFYRIKCNFACQADAAVKHCYELGYRKPVLVTDCERFSDWHGGFQAAVDRLGLAKNAHILSLPDWDERRFTAWYLRHRPDVVLGNMDDFPLSALARHHLFAPADFGYCCLDIPPMDNTTSGYRQNRERRNALTVEFLHGLLRKKEIGLPEVPLAIEIDGKWQNGETLKKLNANTCEQTEAAH